jgi:hypothetical protein
VIVDPPTPEEGIPFGKFCQDGFCYWYDPARGQWYYLDGSGARVYIEGNPPGFDPGPYWPSEATLGSLQGYSRADYGLVPDTEGKVAPLMWFTNLANSTWDFTKNDVLDFYMVTDLQWELPTDRSNMLVAAIGTDNIHRYAMPLPSGENAALFHLRNVSVSNLIEFLSQMSIKQVNSQATGGTYTLKLSGPQANYTGVDIYWNGLLVHNVDLR